MRFTEHELTRALTGTAKSVLAAQHRGVRKGKADIDTVWEEMDRYQRFKLLDSLGSQILPVLVALPDVEVEPGTRPSFTDRQILEVVESRVGEVGRRFRRKVAVAGQLALVRTAGVLIFAGPVIWYCLFGPNMTMARGFLGRSLGRSAEMIDLPMIFFTSAVPVAFALIVLHLLARLAMQLTGQLPPPPVRILP